MEPLPTGIDRNSDAYIFFTGTRGNLHYQQGVKFNAPHHNQPAGTFVVWEIVEYDGNTKLRVKAGISRNWQFAMDRAIELKRKWRNRRSVSVNSHYAVELSPGEFYMLRHGPIEWLEEGEQL